MKLKLPILFLVCAILIASFGAAALSSVSLEREVSATVLADKNDNVAVKFEGLVDYTSIVKQNANGEVSFDLSEVLGSANGFNTEAQFTIGSTAGYVFKITNNSGIAVKVSMVSNADSIVLYESAGAVAAGGTTIAVGAAKEFYFGIDTAGIPKNTALEGTLSVEEA